MITTGTVQGHPAVWLENDLLKVTVLPEKGADIYELIHKPSGVDFLLKTPDGLRPPGDRPATDFLENYAGGWQELFPNANDACNYRGQVLPFHGEVALLAWDCAVERDDEAETAARFSVRCRQTPFHLVRTMRLHRGASVLEIEERVTNESDTPAEFVWGHHVVLGGTFLEGGCWCEAPACSIVTPDQLYEPETARLAPGQREPWPLALGRSPGERVDLRHVPGPEAHSHDDAFLTDLAQGYVAVTNPRLALRFLLAWDAALFRYMVMWQPYGGADLPPLTGIYGLGIEPWVSRFNLEQALVRGEAQRLGPHQSLTTKLRAVVIDEYVRGDDDAT